MSRLDVLKMIYGFLMLLILGTLAFSIALGKVSQEHSFGLEPIITTLATLAGSFAGWAFREKFQVITAPPPRAAEEPTTAESKSEVTSDAR